MTQRWQISSVAEPDGRRRLDIERSGTSPLREVFESGTEAVAGVADWLRHCIAGAERRPDAPLRLLLADGEQAGRAELARLLTTLTLADELPLGCRSDVTLSLDVVAASPVGRGALQDSLRVLVMAASPEDLPALNPDLERNGLRDALRERIEGGRVELFERDSRSKQALVEAIAEVQPHLFHFIGHAKARGDDVQLALAGRSGTAVYIPSDELATLLTRAGVRFALLNACGSEPLAERLARRGLAALGMADSLLDRSGRVFAQGFYQVLSQGGALDQAASEGRYRIWLEDRDGGEWALPTLFVANGDVDGFRVPDRAVPTAQVLLSSSPDGASIFVDEERQPGLTPQTLRLRLDYPQQVRFERTGFHPRVLTLTPKDLKETHNVVLEPLLGALDISTQPRVADTLIRCSPLERAGQPIEARTDLRGRASIHGLPAGRYSIEALCELKATEVEVKDLSKGATALALQLPLELYLSHGLAEAAARLGAWIRRPTAWLIAALSSLVLVATVSALLLLIHPEPAPDGMVSIDGAEGYQVLGVDLTRQNTPPMADETANAYEARFREGDRLIKEIRNLVRANQVERFWGPAPAVHHLAEPLYVDKYEVSVGAYQAFLDAIDDNEALWKHHRQDNANKTIADLEPEEWSDQQACPQCPVVHVDLYDAWSYCRFHDKTLPTAVEWEMAARGPQGRLYPWGGDYKPWNYNGFASTKKLVPVRDASFAAGDTPDTGLRHMAGNAEEWVIAEETGSTIVSAAKGGSYVSRGPLPVLAYGMLVQPPTQQDNTTGFRCVSRKKQTQDQVELPPGDYRVGGLSNYLFDLVRDLSPIASGNQLQRLLGESPQQVTIKDFFVDKSEVTIGDYKAFLDALETKPALRDYLRHSELKGLVVDYIPGTPDTTGHWSNQVLKSPDLPVTSTNWYQATAYCKWRGKRLPTLFELELLMGGPNGNYYPFGDDWSLEALIEAEARNKGRINVRDVGPGNPVAANDPGYQDDRGLFHLYGNVTEWVDDPRYTSGAYAHVKGGNFDHHGQLRSFRFVKEPLEKNTRAETIGFRCARGR